MGGGLGSTALGYPDRGTRRADPAQHRQYQRANGEVIALLVIAPSKTDRERVIPMSAELFHVIAQIIKRHTGGAYDRAAASL
ncbi:hypothetical protein ACWEQA_23845 [Nocardia sp. NPDC004085]